MATDYPFEFRHFTSLGDVQSVQPVSFNSTIFLIFLHFGLQISLKSIHNGGTNATTSGANPTITLFIESRAGNDVAAAFRLTTKYAEFHNLRIDRQRPIRFGFFARRN